MRFSLITSNIDNASLNIKNSILEKVIVKEKEKKNDEIIYKIDENVILIETNKDLIFFDEAEKYTQTDLLIFLSKHKSESGIPGFYLHSIGNFTSNTIFGGKPNFISYTSAYYMKRIFLKLYEISSEEFKNWKIGLEVTHHGPYIEKTPAIFLEIGSKQEDWNNKKAAEIIAKVVLEITKEKKEDRYIPAVGYGGPHYAPAFLKYQKESEYAIGHIISAYDLENFDESMIIQPILKTWEKVNIALIDWKGIKGEKRQKLIDILNKNNIKFLKI